MTGNIPEWELLIDTNWCLSEIGSKPHPKTASDAKVLEFQWEFIVRNSVESLP